MVVLRYGGVSFFWCDGVDALPNVKNCCGEVFYGGVLRREWWRGVEQRSVGGIVEKCCREVLERSVLRNVGKSMVEMCLGG